MSEGVVEPRSTKPWQVFVFTAQAIGRPSPQRRRTQKRVTGVHEQLRRSVIELFSLQRTNHTDVVNHRRQVRQQLAHPLSTFAVLAEFKDRAEHAWRSLDERETFALKILLWTIRSVQPLERRFVFKQLQLRRRSSHM